MDLFYDYNKKKVPGKDKAMYYAQEVHSNDIHLTDIAKNIAEKSSATPGDVLSILDNFFLEVGKNVFDSNRVIVDGVCIFSAKLTSEGVDKPEDLHGKEITFNGLKVQFTKKFINQFDYKIHHAPSAMKKYHVNLGELDERRHRLIQYLQDQPVMTTRIYQEITGTQEYKAREELLQFVEEGLIKKHGKNNRYYTLIE